MSGVLLDSHALYWLVSGTERLTDAALTAIGKSQRDGTLLVSPISAWELAVAATKTRSADRPDLGDVAPDRWFRRAITAVGAKIAPISTGVAAESAGVVARTGHKDPGDCFLIATARVRRVPLVTRDRLIRAIGANQPEFLDLIVC